ncbi:MAG: hypothetical protein DRP09_18135 [Candidatus Thorarchaeota archaeon]|nr:MAG: hypothetical protein DRP09_18135 [Candidatus Thorarchaeota archaeon]
MEKSERIEQLIELVVIEYSKSYDIDIAMLKAEVSDEDRAILEKDSDFLYRIAYEDALIRETIIENMVKNVKSSNPQLSQKAAVDLGNILYKSKFSKKDEPMKLIIPDKIVLVGAE